jgi:AcrR family transcriptional regulator
MQSIARAAGVSKATLYNHFRTKDEVARVLLAAELDRLTAAAAALPTAEGLAVLADELGGHPVLRRLRETDPEVLLALLAAGPGTWPRLVERLAGAVGTDVGGAELAARWLLGVALQPGRSTTRHRHAAQLAQVLAADPAADSDRTTDTDTAAVAGVQLSG